LKQIRLSKGLYALVDDDDFEWLSQWSWYASHESRGTKWYAIRREKGVKIRMHVAIWVRHNGPVPKKLVIDHVNHNSLDNRKYVAECDPSQVRINVKPQLEAITQVENMRRSPGFKQKGQKYAQKRTDGAGGLNQKIDILPKVTNGQSA
jgi:hypothetical protein